MGTNYYTVTRGVELIDPDAFWELKNSECDSILHIGKSSSGWCFSLHVIEERGINDVWDWFDLLLDPERIIINEYRDEILFSELIQCIMRRSRDERYKWDDAMYERNYAEAGPNNLSRHKLGNGCTKHGAGTWDCIEGQFS